MQPATCLIILDGVRMHGVHPGLNDRYLFIRYTARIPFSHFGRTLWRGGRFNDQLSRLCLFVFQRS